MKEARRLLKAGGRLCVAEPLAEGPGQYVMELYHDETAVRRDATEALKQDASPLFHDERVFYFEEVRDVPDFDVFAAQARRRRPLQRLHRGGGAGAARSAAGSPK